MTTGNNNLETQEAFDTQEAMVKQPRGGKKNVLKLSKKKHTVSFGNFGKDENDDGYENVRVSTQLYH